MGDHQFAIFDFQRSIGVKTRARFWAKNGCGFLWWDFGQPRFRAKIKGEAEKKDEKLKKMMQKDVQFAVCFQNRAKILIPVRGPLGQAPRRL